MKNFTLEQHKSKQGCTSFFIMMDGECKGTVKKISSWHEGYEQTQTFYHVFWGDINIKPTKTFSPQLFKTGRIKKAFGATYEVRRYENGHVTRKRMMKWIASMLEGEK